jgi:hypothetical protein
MAGTGGWLLADVTSVEPVVAACWELVRAGAEVDRVLGALLSSGFRSVASFALVRQLDLGAHVVVRGGARVELVGLDGELVEVRTVRAGDWADRAIDQPLAGLRLLTTDAAPDPAQTVLPLDRGVVLAATLTVRLTAATPHSWPVSPHASVTSPHDVPITPHNGSVPPHAEPASPVDPPRAVDPARHVDPPRHVDPVRHVEPVVPVVPVSAFDRMRRESAPARADEDEESFPQPANRGAEPGVATLPPMQTLVPQPRESTGLIEDVSWAEPVDAGPLPATQRREPVVQPASAQPPEVPGELADELLLTVHRARRAATGPEPGGTGPVVSAVRCLNGHLNPPTGVTCRVCSTGIPVQAQFLVSRPTLGVLRLSDGEVIQLDRGVILGRAPGIPEGNDRDRPHHVKLPSPDNDISRKHTEVYLDGWEVTVVDLNSRNGTVVTPPGGVPETLPPGGSRVLEPGAVVSLTETVSFRFEVTA